MIKRNVSTPGSGNIDLKINSSEIQQALDDNSDLVYIRSALAQFGSGISPDTIILFSGSIKTRSKTTDFNPGFDLDGDSNYYFASRDTSSDNASSTLEITARNVSVGEPFRIILVLSDKNDTIEKNYKISLLEGWSADADNNLFFNENVMIESEPEDVSPIPSMNDFYGAIQPILFKSGSKFENQSNSSIRYITTHLIRDSYSRDGITSNVELINKEETNLNFTDSFQKVELIDTEVALNNKEITPSSTHTLYAVKDDATPFTGDLHFDFSKQIPLGEPITIKVALWNDSGIVVSGSFAYDSHWTELNKLLDTTGQWNNETDGSIARILSWRADILNEETDAGDTHATQITLMPSTANVGVSTQDKKKTNAVDVLVLLEDPDGLEEDLSLNVTLTHPDVRPDIRLVWSTEDAITPKLTSQQLLVTFYLESEDDFLPENKQNINLSFQIKSENGLNDATATFVLVLDEQTFEPKVIDLSFELFTYQSYNDGLGNEEYIQNLQTLHNILEDFGIEYASSSSYIVKANIVGEFYPGFYNTISANDTLFSNKVGIDKEHILLNDFIMNLENEYVRTDCPGEYTITLKTLLADTEKELGIDMMLHVIVKVGGVEFNLTNTKGNLFINSTYKNDLAGKVKIQSSFMDSVIVKSWLNNTYKFKIGEEQLPKTLQDVVTYINANKVEGNTIQANLVDTMEDYSRFGVVVNITSFAVFIVATRGELTLYIDDEEQQQHTNDQVFTFDGVLGKFLNIEYRFNGDSHTFVDPSFDISITRRYGESTIDICKNELKILQQGQVSYSIQFNTKDNYGYSYNAGLVIHIENNTPIIISATNEMNSKYTFRSITDVSGEEGYGVFDLPPSIVDTLTRDMSVMLVDSQDDVNFDIDTLYFRENVNVSLNLHSNTLGDVTAVDNVVYKDVFSLSQENVTYNDIFTQEITELREAGDASWNAFIRSIDEITLTYNAVNTNYKLRNESETTFTVNTIIKKLFDEEIVLPETLPLLDISFNREYDGHGDVENALYPLPLRWFDVLSRGVSYSNRERSGLIEVPLLDKFTYDTEGVATATITDANNETYTIQAFATLNETDLALDASGNETLENIDAVNNVITMKTITITYVFTHEEPGDSASITVEYSIQNENIPFVEATISKPKTFTIEYYQEPSIVDASLILPIVTIDSNPFVKPSMIDSRFERQGEWKGENESALKITYSATITDGVGRVLNIETEDTIEQTIPPLPTFDICSNITLTKNRLSFMDKFEWGTWFEDIVGNSTVEYWKILDTATSIDKLIDLDTANTVKSVKFTLLGGSNIDIRDTQLYRDLETGNANLIDTIKEFELSRILSNIEDRKQLHAIEIEYLVSNVVELNDVLSNSVFITHELDPAQEDEDPPIISISDKTLTYPSFESVSLGTILTNSGELKIECLGLSESLTLRDVDPSYILFDVSDNALNGVATTKEEMLNSDLFIWNLRVTRQYKLFSEGNMEITDEELSGNTILALYEKIDLSYPALYEVSVSVKDDALNESNSLDFNVFVKSIVNKLKIELMETGEDGIIYEKVSTSGDVISELFSVEGDFCGNVIINLDISGVKLQNYYKIELTPELRIEETRVESNGVVGTQIPSNVDFSVPGVYVLTYTFTAKPETLQITSDEDALFVSFENAPPKTFTVTLVIRDNDPPKIMLNNNLGLKTMVLLVDDATILTDVNSENNPYAVTVDHYGLDPKALPHTEARTFISNIIEVSGNEFISHYNLFKGLTTHKIVSDELVTREYDVENLEIKILNEDGTNTTLRTLNLFDSKTVDMLTLDYLNASSNILYSGDLSEKQLRLANGKRMIVEYVGLTTEGAEYKFSDAKYIIFDNDGNDDNNDDVAGAPVLENRGVLMEEIPRELLVEATKEKIVAPAPAPAPVPAPVPARVRAPAPRKIRSWGVSFTK